MFTHFLAEDHWLHNTHTKQQDQDQDRHQLSRRSATSRDNHKSHTTATYSGRGGIEGFQREDLLCGEHGETDRRLVRGDKSEEDSCSQQAE